MELLISFNYANFIIFNYISTDLPDWYITKSI